MKKLIITAIALAAGVSFVKAQILTPITSFNDIELWAGSGIGSDYRAALVIDFGGNNVFAWGFGWNQKDIDDGKYDIKGPTGGDMITAITTQWKNLEVNTDYPNSIYYTPLGGETMGAKSGIGPAPDFDWFFWAYFGVGGTQTVRGNFSDENPFGEPIDFDPVDGGALTPPSSNGWTYLWCVPEERYLENGSWDAFVFTACDEFWDPILTPSGTIFAAVPEPSTCAFVFAGVVALCALRRKALAN